jgi:GDP-L-fucose synthase
VIDPGDSSWTRRRVVVTGGEGFLGGVLVAALQDAGAEVRVVRHAEHDLRTADGAREAVDGAEVVFHLAATVGGIGFNLRHPAVLAHDNLLLAAHIFEQSHLAGVDRLIAVSSVCSYPNATPVPFREEDIWAGYPEPSNAPYGVAKRALLTLSDAYWKQYGLRSCTPILTNLYGPGDRDDLEDAHVIPALIRKFLLAREQPGEPIEIWGSGAATRDFLYVDDAARALILAAERVEQPLVVNIGSGVETSIAELVKLIAELTGFSGELRWNLQRPDGQARRRVDVTRARTLLEFEPRMTLAEGLSRTVATFAEA